MLIGPVVDTANEDPLSIHHQDVLVGILRELQRIYVPRTREITCNGIPSFVKALVALSELRKPLRLSRISKSTNDFPLCVSDFYKSVTLINNTQHLPRVVQIVSIVAMNVRIIARPRRKLTFPPEPISVIFYALFGPAIGYRAFQIIITKRILLSNDVTHIVPRPNPFRLSCNSRNAILVLDKIIPNRTKIFFPKDLTRVRGTKSLDRNSRPTFT